MRTKQKTIERPLDIPQEKEAEWNIRWTNLTEFHEILWFSN